MWRRVACACSSEVTASDRPAKMFVWPSARMPAIWSSTSPMVPSGAVRMTQ
jgi:hypothetical protein